MNLFEAFNDELEKIAAGPLIHHEPGMYRDHGIAGKMVRHANLWKENPALAKRIGSDPKVPRDVLFIAPESEFTAMHGERGKEAYKAIRRHEMTHWLRGRRGKMARYGKPGVRGVGTTLREELIAHTSSLKGRSPAVQTALAYGLVPGAFESTYHAYPGQTLRQAATSGRFGKALRKLMLLR